MPASAKKSERLPTSLTSLSRDLLVGEARPCDSYNEEGLMMVGGRCNLDWIGIGNRGLMGYDRVNMGVGRGSRRRWRCLLASFVWSS